MLLSTVFVVTAIVALLVCGFIEYPLRSIQKWFFQVVGDIFGKGRRE